LLARGPMFRPLALRRGHASHRLLVTVHHVVFDGWSRSVFCRELAALYAGFSEGRPSPPTPRHLTMGDVVSFERSAAGAAVASRHLDYWRRAIVGAPLTLDLPRAGARRSAVRRGARHSTRVPAGVVARLRSFGERHDATLPVVTLAAFE